MLLLNFRFLLRSKSHSPLTPGESIPGDTKNCMPAMMHAAGRVITQFDWTRSHGHPEAMTAAQGEALHTAQRIAEEICIKLDTEEGDIQFINNLALVHARNEFQDSGEISLRILRFGLRDPINAWELPAKYADTFDAGGVGPPAQ